MKYLLIIALMLLLTNCSCPDNTTTDETPPPDETLTEYEKYKRTNKKFLETWKDEAANRGGRLVFKDEWNSEVVNAYANQEGNTWYVVIHGALWRHEKSTPDATEMVYCHELGHHMGGTPRYSNSWASAEGQSDYWGANVCAKKMWANDDNKKKIEGKYLSEYVKSNCEKSVPEKEYYLCLRIALAAFDMGKFLYNGDGPTPKQDLKMPAISGIQLTHPKAQCRYETGLAGGLCDKNYRFVDCISSQGYGLAARPKCWHGVQDFRAIIPAKYVAGIIPKG
ncbi:MAG: hypothetical protein QNK36_06465 [Colwellia sp.]|nr:hypothetical protein [Colwellia sp.]